MKKFACMVLGLVAAAPAFSQEWPTKPVRFINPFPADRQSQIRMMLADGLKGVISQVLCRKIGGGRVPAMEVMIGTPPISNLIREAKTFQIPSMIQSGKRFGMCLLNDSLVDLVKRNLVTPQEAYAKAVDKASLLGQFSRSGVDVSWAPKEGGGPAGASAAAAGRPA